MLLKSSITIDKVDYLMRNLPIPEGKKPKFNCSNCYGKGKYLTSHPTKGFVYATLCSCLKEIKE